MKNLLYILLFVFTATFSACKSDKATIDKLMLTNYTLEFYLEGLSYKAGNGLDALKAQVMREGNLTEDLQFIKQAEILETETNKIISKIDKIKKRLVDEKGQGKNKKTGEIINPQAIVSTSDLGVLKKDLENYLNYIHSITNKQEKPIPLSIVEEDFLTTTNLHKQPLAAVLALLTQKQIIIIDFKIQGFKNIQSKVTKLYCPDCPILPFVSVKSDIVPLRENYKARIFFVQVLNKNIVEMTFNNTPVTVDKNGVGKVRFKAENLGWQTWRGSIKYKGKYRDSTFNFIKTYYVMPKLK